VVFRFGFVFVFGVFFSPAHPAETLMWKGCGERGSGGGKRGAKARPERERSKSPRKRKLL